MKLVAFTALTLSTITLAHPGHGIQEEIESRKAFIRESTNLQVKCGATLRARGIEQRAKARRQALAEDMRKRRGLNNDGKYFTSNGVETLGLVWIIIRDLGPQTFHCSSRDRH